MDQSTVETSFWGVANTVAQIGMYGFWVWAVLVVPVIIGLIISKPFNWNRTGGPNPGVIFTRVAVHALMWLLFLGGALSLMISMQSANPLTN